MQVRDTYLSKIIPGDAGMYTNPGNFLGHVIVLGEGNRGRDENGDGNLEPGRSSGNYTHVMMVVEPPDPMAEVELVRFDNAGRKIYKVKDPKRSGVKIHATWPTIKIEPIDWSEQNLEVWRVREVQKKYCEQNRVPVEALRAVEWAWKRNGKVYDWVQFITFGLLRLSNAWVCSHFYFDAFKAATKFSDTPIILSPSGDFDSLATPNDLINSAKMIRMRFQGELGSK